MLKWERGSDTHVAEPTTGLLGGFARLSRQSDEEIAAFARRMGVLFWKSDDRGHGSWCAACTVARGGSLGADLPHAFLEHGAEPVDAWRRIAADIRGCLVIAARFAKEEKVSPDEWALFGNLVGVRSLGLDGALDDAVSVRAPSNQEAMIDSSGALGYIGVMGAPSFVVMHLVNVMLARTVTRLVLHPDGTRALQIEPSGLLGEIGLQLARAVVNTTAFAVCSGCGEMFAPSRKPRAGERAWCEQCRAARQPQRAAQRDYARRGSKRP